MSTLLDRHTKRSFMFLTSRVDAYSSTVTEQASLLTHGPGSRIFDPAAGALALLQQRIGAQALLSAFNACFYTLAFTFLAASLLVFFMRKPGDGVVVDTNAAH